MQIEEYAANHPHYYKGDFSNHELNFLLKNNVFTNVIDVGCGDGSLLYSLKKLGYLDKFNEIWAVDLSKKRLSLVKMISDNIKTVQGDAQELIDIPTDYFDLVISTQVIEHVKDDNRMIQSLFRICKKGGIVYLDTIFKKPYGWYFYRNHYGKWALDPTHEREYMNEDELLNKIQKSGFKIIYSKKNMQNFPIIAFFVRRLNIQNRRLYENPVVKFLRIFKIPVIGYYCWKIVMIKP